MTIHAADLFCGAGGTSTGLAIAVKRMGLHVDLVAVNHWQRAVETHTRNHPWARHVCADLASVEADPSRLVAGGRLDLLVASPECTHHSIARGGKPCSDQSRASAWHILHWCERLDVGEVLVENVREFESWGPLLRQRTRIGGKWYEAGRPDPRHKGETFGVFAAGLRSMGYAVEWRVLDSADYGAATSRKRLFLRASRRGSIKWPVPTHVGHHRAAREIIDWDFPSQDIRERKRPLAPRTMARIEAGLRKFGGEAFIAVLRGTSPNQEGAWAKSVEEPLGTISTGGVHHALCEPFVVGCGGRRGQSAPRSCSAPLNAITTKNDAALCEPFILGQHSGGSPRSVSHPMPTICTESRGIALVEPFVIPMEHSGRQPVRGTDKPLPTITTAKGGSFGLCEPFLAKYNGTATARPVSEPLDTICTRDRFALVEPYRMGIRFRMLQPHELAAAMGFRNYQFAGNKTEIVKQIGNAVQVDMAEALCLSMLQHMSASRQRQELIG